MYLIFIQARLSSRRLKGKVLKKIQKKKILEIIFQRLNRCTTVKKYVVLTSRGNEDNKIINVCKKNNIEFFLGSLNNVFLRFKNASKKYKTSRIIRINADSPLIDWRLIDRMIKISKKKKFDIFTNVLERTFPKGQSVEIINTKIFNIKSTNFTNSDKEHVTKYFYKNKDKFKIYNFKNKINFSKYNLSIDTKKDFLKISKIIKKKGIYKKWEDYIE